MKCFSEDLIFLLAFCNLLIYFRPLRKLIMKNLFLCLLFLLSFVSCRNSDEGILEKNVPTYDVYVSGMENSLACYWKNNIKTNLTLGDNLRASKIIVENNNTYILGNNINLTSQGQYYFWKNNIREDLRQYLSIPSTAPFAIFDMAIDNGDEYFIGYYDTFSPIGPDQYAFCIWKNGVKTILNSNSDPSIYWSSKINIFNHQVYVASHIRVGNSIDSGYFLNSIYNSVPNVSWVCNFSKNSNGINFLYVENQNFVYKNLSTNVNSTIATNFPNLYTGKILSETASTDIYITSSFLDNAYYKNNILTNVPIDPNYSSVRDMFVLNNDIYLIKQQNSPYGSKVYINNVETQSTINNPNQFQNEFNSIFVVQN